MTTAERHWAMPVVAGTLAASVGVAALGGEHKASASESDPQAQIHNVGSSAVNNTVEGVIDTPNGNPLNARSTPEWNGWVTRTVNNGQEVQIVCQTRTFKEGHSDWNNDGNREFTKDTWYFITDDWNSWSQNSGWSWNQNGGWNKNGSYHEEAYRGGGDDGGDDGNNDWNNDDGNNNDGNNDWNNDGGDGNDWNNDGGNDGWNNDGNNNWNNDGKDGKDGHNDWNKDGHNHWNKDGHWAGWGPQKGIKTWDRVPSCPRGFGVDGGPQHRDP